MANRLAAETSPYLLQHADQPVDWYPWGEEAFARARAEDKPVLLSVGYSACHWCHVMAHESFDDPAIAARMNAEFINVKVDREERPDVDALYMEAVQAMTGHGGWPMTVFLTPEGAPFYGGTYFPPTARHGMPGFDDLMKALLSAWRERRDEIDTSADRLADAIRVAAAPATSEGALTFEISTMAARQAVSTVDPRHGGFGGAPKFPGAPMLRYLLDHALRRQDAGAMRAVTASLGAMARGGLRDHLAGGFHRYCVDATWTVPHFEKMLYDNAQLADIYLDAWRATGLSMLRDVAVETLDWMVAEMLGAEGGFYASQDADSEGGEGSFYVWTPEQVRALMDSQTADAVLAWYGIEEGGNFEGGATVLTARNEAEALARSLGVDTKSFVERVQDGRAALSARRATRPAPETDEKVITSWNALAIAAFARAGAVLGRGDYLTVADQAARYVLGTVLNDDGGLAHSRLAGRSGAPAFLEDMAGMAWACLELYEATFDPSWLEEARQLLDETELLFAAPDGGFYRSGPRHDTLFAKQKELTDGAVPAGNALMARALLRAASLLGEPDYRRRAAVVLSVARPILERAPLAAGTMLAALDDELAESREIAVLGSADDAAPMLQVVRARHRPGTVVAWHAAEGAASEVPLLAAHRDPESGAEAWVCHNHRCHAPVSSAAALADALGSPWPEESLPATWLDPEDNTGS